MDSENTRYKTGFKNLLKIDKEEGEKVIDRLNAISPDLGKYIIEYAFGDIYNREGLDLKSKEISVVAALTTMANASPQLKVHINAALNVGCNIAEIHEVIMQMSVYAGFPGAINGMRALQEVLEERKKNGISDEEGRIESTGIPINKTRYDVGAEQLTKLNKGHVKILEESFKDISSDFGRYVVEFAFADILSRPALDLKYREMATIAALTVKGTAPSQLEFHIKAGLKIGITKEEIEEIIILMSVYSGFPSSINAVMILKEVIDKEQ